MVDAVIFDIDGTLLDSVTPHAECWVETFAHFGFEVPLATMQGQIGKGGGQIISDVVNLKSGSVTPDAISSFREKLFKSKYFSRVEPFRGVRALFDALIQNNVRVALGSSAKESEIEGYKERAGIGDLDLVHASSGDVERSKPYPDIVEVVLEKLGDLAPEKCVFVGDSTFDAKAAKAANVRCIGLLSGGFAASDLRNSGCTAIYADIAELFAAYASNPGWLSN